MRKVLNWFTSILTMALLAYMLVSLVPLQDFTRGPSRGPVQPAFAQLFYPLGPMGNLGFNITTFAAGAQTVPAYSLVGMVLGVPTASVNYTTDTATNICALFPFVGAQNATGTGTANANFAWDFYLKDNAGGAFTLTLVAGTGVTVTGTATAAQANVRHFKVALQACPAIGLATPTAAVNFQSLETAAF